jgi:hypothetical protein
LTVAVSVAVFPDESVTVNRNEYNPAPDVNSTEGVPVFAPVIDADGLPAATDHW